MVARYLVEGLASRKPFAEPRLVIQGGLCQPAPEGDAFLVRSHRGSRRRPRAFARSAGVGHSSLVDARTSPAELFQYQAIKCKTLDAGGHHPAVGVRLMFGEGTHR